jgi:RNA ligase partner protein
MTPGCVEEMQSFFDMGKVAPELLTKLHIKAPNTGAMVIPAAVVGDLVMDFRIRGDKALKFATDLVREAYVIPPQEHKKGEPDPVYPLVTRLRDGMRQHLRTNFIDSKQDFDTLLLALELRARLVTGDLGMRSWANKLGIEWMEPALLLST